MKYDFIAIPDADVPRAVEPTFQHVLTGLTMWKLNPASPGPGRTSLLTGRERRGYR